MLPAKDVPHSPDDETILRYAVELFNQLGITKPEPDAIAWDDDMNADLVIVRYGEVRLPRRMMGRLTPEDWKLLLAPAVIYNYIVSRDWNRDSLLHLVLPLTPAPILFSFSLLAIVRYAKGPVLTDLLFTLTSLYAVYSIILLGLYIKRRWRRLFYTADREAADKLGKDVLLAALAKYGQTISATGYSRKRLHLWPTVGQRIERLREGSR